MTPPALLFDLDGTLVDSVPDLQAALNRLLAEHGHPPLDRAAVTAMVGDGTPALVDRGLRAAGLDAVDRDAAYRRFIAFYEADATTLTRPYPGVPALLDLLSRRGWRLAVCTNKPQAASLAVLRGLDLARYFPVVMGGDRLPQRKPDPAPVRSALHELGGDPGRAALLGDHANDVIAGQAAGLKAVLARYGYGGGPLDRLTPDAVIDRIADLPAALTALGIG